MTDKVDRKINKMSSCFPQCPLCSEEAGYKSSGGIWKVFVSCRSCKAVFDSPQFFEDIEIRQLKLVDEGKSRNAKALIGKMKSVEFWRNLDIATYHRGYEEEIESLLNKAYISYDSDTEVHAKTMEQIMNLGPTGLAEITCSGLFKQDAKYKWEALFVVGLLGDNRWVETTLELLGSPDESVRVMAVVVGIKLSCATDKDVLIPKLIDLLKNDKSVQVRCKIADELRGIKSDARVIEALAEAIDDRAAPPDDKITAGSWTGIAIASVKAKHYYSVRELALHSLAELKSPQTAKILVDHELNGSRNINDEEPIIEAMGVLAREPLIKALKSDNLIHRTKATACLIWLISEPMVEPVIAVLDDKHYMARRYAANVLGAVLELLGDQRAVEPLKRVSEEDENQMVREAAVQALKRLRA